MLTSHGIFRKVSLLWHVVKFNFLKVIAYPWEWIAFFAQRIVFYSLLLIFWFAVAQSSANALNFRSLVAYFLIASSVREVTFAYQTKMGRDTMRYIQYGDLNNYLIKPVPTIPFLFFSYIGQNWMPIAYSAFAIVAGVIILPPVSIINILEFIAFLILAFMVSISFNLFVAILGFHMIEANGLRNAFNHTAEIFSGILIPMTFFPGIFRTIVMYSPFPIVAFTPAYVLQNSLKFGEVFTLFAVSLAWAAGLLFLMVRWWKWSLRKYEGVGI